MLNDYASKPINNDTNNDLKNNSQSIYSLKVQSDSLISRNIPFSIMIFCIDNFENINNFYSITFGEKVLLRYYNEISATLSSNIKLFILENGYFVMIKVTSNTSLLSIDFEKFQKIANSPNNFDGLFVSLSISAGICSYPNYVNDFESLYTNANIALDAAKNSVNNKCIFYTNELSKFQRIDMQLLDSLKWSIDNNFLGFSLSYQPIFKSEDMSIIGCEALLRWSTSSFPKGVPPSTFIPLLIKHGLIKEISKYVIDTAFKQCSIWNRIIPSFNINVNVSSLQLEQLNFKDFVINTLNKYNLDPKYITLELTDSNKPDSKLINTCLTHLKNYGIKIAYDDYSTDYSSPEIFSYISADELKIDKSFIQEITFDKNVQKQLKNIIDMCHAMNITVCVEGIENKEIADIVVKMGPLLLQGYYYSKPLAPQDFEKKYIYLVDIKQRDVKFKSNRTLSPVKALSSENLLNNANCGIIQLSLDKNLNLLAYNDGFKKITGYSQQDIENKFNNSAIEMINPNDIKRVLSECKTNLNKSYNTSIVLRILRSDDVYIWVTSTLSTIKSISGLNSVVVTIIDNDKYLQENIAIKEALMMQQTLLNNLSVESICLKNDKDYSINYISSSLLSILGYSKQEIIEDFDYKFINMIYPIDKQQFINKLNNMIINNEPIYFNYRIVCKTGTILFFESIIKFSYNNDYSNGTWNCSVVKISKYHKQ